MDEKIRKELESTINYINCGEFNDEVFISYDENDTNFFIFIYIINLQKKDAILTSICNSFVNTIKNLNDKNLRNKIVFLLVNDKYYPDYFNSILDIFLESHIGYHIVIEQLDIYKQTTIRMLSKKYFKKQNIDIVRNMEHLNLYYDNKVSLCIKCSFIILFFIFILIFVIPGTIFFLLGSLMSLMTLH